MVHHQETSCEHSNLDEEEVKTRIDDTNEETPAIMCVIDVNQSSEGKESDQQDSNMEKVCRICHLSVEHHSRTSDLIELGCHCKDELGISHRLCADTWFKHKGNRVCEICGETANNVVRVIGRGFAIRRNEGQLMVVPSRISSVSSMDDDDDLGSSCCVGKGCRNLVLTILVLAFIFPWFFRLGF